MPEKDYSSRSLIDKLGVKEGMRVAVFEIEDEEFRTALRERTANWFEGLARKDCDLALLGVSTRADLAKISKTVASLKPNGGLWIVYPKGRKDTPKGTSGKPDWRRDW